MPLIRNGRVADDPWTALADDAPVPAEGDVIVSLTRLTTDAGALKQRPGRLGVRIEPDQDVGALAPHLDALSLVALAFPKFNDGRAFSHARLLRERLGFAGEIRAVGDVLRDQLFYMARAGFDAFEIAREDAAAVFAAAMGEMHAVYQGSSDGRRPVWMLRRGAVAESVGLKGAAVSSRPIGSNGGETPKERAARLNAQLRDAPAEEVLRVALAEFPGRIAAVSSFGAEAAVLIETIARVDATLPVLFLETGKHFPETLAHREDLIARVGLKDARLIHPEASEVAAEDPTGDLHARNADACCALRKTRPLSAVLEGFDAWISGRKRFQTSSRLSLPIVEADEQGRIKFNPLANWSQQDLDAYMAERGLPKHPLVAQGYLSIGCAPEICTSRTAPGEDARAGRWRGQDKDECGIHFTPDGRMVRTRTAAADAS